MTEQRYRAVLEVEAGVPVTEVAERFGVSRQAAHRWIGWYREEGLDGLADRSHRPHAHPAQTSPEVEAAICELRRNHGRTVTVEAGDTTWRIYHGDELLTEAVHTSTKPIARFNVRKPEPHAGDVSCTNSHTAHAHGYLALVAPPDDLEIARKRLPIGAHVTGRVAHIPRPGAIGVLV